MNIQTMTPNEIKKIGFEVLVNSLGPVGLVRFLQQFELGKGDYPRERGQWLTDLDVRTIVKEIKTGRKGK